MKREPVITYARDTDGAEIVRVSLANHPVPAKLLRKDFERLQAMGVSPMWTFNPRNAEGTGPQVRVRCSERPGCSMSVARIIAEAEPKTQVRHADGDRLNLRSDNLILRQCRWAKHGVPAQWSGDGLEAGSADETDAGDAAREGSERLILRYKGRSVEIPPIRKKKAVKPASEAEGQAPRPVPFSVRSLYEE